MHVPNIGTVSLFSNQLQIALKNAGMTRTELSAAAGIPYRTLSNYASDVNRPDADAVAQICDALPDDERAPLIAARVADECPAKFRHLVLIEPRSGSLNEELPPLSGIPMSQELKRNLESLARAAVQNESWRVAVESLAKLL